MSFEIKQIITQIIAFLIMLWILKKYAWKPLLQMLDERTAKIEAAFREIDEKNLQADKLKADYLDKINNIKEEGQVIIQDAIKRGQEDAQDLQLDAQRKASETIQKALKEIERENAKAKVQFKNEMVDLTLLAVEKIARLKLSQEEREKYSLKILDEV